MNKYDRDSMNEKQPMSEKQSCVYLVGAGPGDPRLLTIRGLQCLQQADVVLYDGLVNPLILRHTNGELERTARVKREGAGIVGQDQVIARLIELGKAGKTVVRLKGGDPFIFGRGGEEAEALAEAGIPYEIVPGITAANAVAAYAGISLTHRHDASAVVFVTGHEALGKQNLAIDFTALARFPGTIVFYMGLRNLDSLVTSLLEAGMSPDRPSAMICQGALPSQREISTSLGNMVEEVGAAGLEPPSLLVIGEVTHPDRRLRWYEQKPLFGKRIGITRPAGQQETEIQRILDLGGEPVPMPTIEIGPVPTTDPLRETIHNLDNFGWLIFTSVNGVDHFMAKLWEMGFDVRNLAQHRFACIGTSTADRLAAYHLRADLIPQQFRGEALAEALIEKARNESVLWIRASRGRDVLPERCRAAGIPIDELVVYDNRDVAAYPAEIQQRLLRGDLDWIGLSSPSIARQFVNLLPEQAKPHIGTRIKLASISPVTSAALRDCGLEPDTEAGEYTWSGILQAILQAEGR